MTLPVRPLHDTATGEQSFIVPAFTFGHVPFLDGLRGIAILVVLAVNTGLPHASGWFIGVDIFFVLSGFLITSLLLYEWKEIGGIRLKNFYVRRVLRLFPALVALLAVLCTYAVFFQTPAEASITYRGSFVTLFYAANWVQAFNPVGFTGALGHAWSLSVEEQFYLLWPLALVLIMRSRLSSRKVIGILVTSIVLSALWRAFLWNEGAHYVRVYCGLDTRADALLTGCLACVLLASGSVRASRPPAFLKLASFFAVGLLIVVGTIATYESGYLYNGVLTLVGLATAILIISLVCFPRGMLAKALSHPVLRWIGQISYGMYLWHFPVFQILAMRKFEQFHVPAFAVHLLRACVVIALASASYYILEKPFLSLKKRFSMG